PSRPQAHEADATDKGYSPRFGFDPGGIRRPVSYSSWHAARLGTGAGHSRPANASLPNGHRSQPGRGTTGLGASVARTRLVGPRLFVDNRAPVAGPQDRSDAR